MCWLVGHRWAMSWYGDDRQEHHVCKRCQHPGMVLNYGVLPPQDTRISVVAGVGILYAVLTIAGWVAVKVLPWGQP